LLSDAQGAIRQGFVLSPKLAQNLSGRRSRLAIRRETPMDWSLVE
jgi:hypothetical protein